MAKVNARALAAIDQYEAGHPLSSDWFPREIWFDKGYRVVKPLPHLFYGNGYWIVSTETAAVLKNCDLGEGSLYSVLLLRSDRKTPIIGEYFSLNFGNVKHAFLPEQSPRARQDYPRGKVWKPPFVMKDDDFAVLPAALEGPDIWIDPAMNRAFFVSGRLAKALKAAGVSRPFGLKQCRILPSPE